MNKKLILLPLTLLSLTLVGCNNKNSSSSSDSSSSEPSEEKYSATVYYPSGNKVTDGSARVQWCNTDTSTCLAPVVTDSEGTATLPRATPGNYVIHLNQIPEGYTYNPNIYHATETVKHVDIHLFDLLTASLVNPDANNSKTNPYAYSEAGYYNVEVESNTSSVYVYFSVKAGENWSLTSLAQTEFATKQTSPKINSYFGTDLEHLSETYDVTNVVCEDSINGKNIYNATTDGVYVAEITASGLVFPGEFTVQLAKL